MLRIYLTGEIILESAGAAVREAALPGRQARLLFARLAFERERPLARDDLAETLWPDKLPPSWDLALSALVSKLRTALAALPGVRRDGVLTQAFGCYHLQLPEPVWIDVEAAAEAVHLAEAAQQGGGLRAAYGHAVVANAITSRPFLPGEDGEWVAGRRENLSRLRVRALDCLVDCLADNGETTLALQDAEAAIRLDPYREVGYRRLMRLHLDAGDRAQGLRAYERCRTLLAEELGVSPSPETEAVYRSLLS